MLVAERGATDNTISSYRKDIKDLYDYLTLNNIKLEKVTSSIIKDFIIELSHRKLGTSTPAKSLTSPR